jgi:hypothetical protein
MMLVIGTQLSTPVPMVHVTVTCNFNYLLTRRQMRSCCVTNYGDKKVYGCNMAFLVWRFYSSLLCYLTRNHARVMRNGNGKRILQKTILSTKTGIFFNHLGSGWNRTGISNINFGSRKTGTGNSVLPELWLECDRIWLNFVKKSKDNLN